MDSILNEINNAQKIAVLSHIDEDCDALASSFAMESFLKSKNKNVTYFVSKKPEDRLEFLGKDYVIFDKNKDYGKFDLTICLDCGDEKRLGERVCIFKNSEKTINIDHHCSNRNFADINKVIGEYSSTGEIIYDFLSNIGETITKTLAEFLYCAIMSDTGCLKYSCANTKTLHCVAELMDKGIDHAYLSRMLFDTEKLEVLKLKGRIMNDIKSFFDGKLNLVSLNVSDIENLGIKENELGDIVNIPRSVKGTEIAVFIRKNDEKVKISFRSNGKYDVGKIAAEFGGGGHKMAAGAVITGKSIEETEQEILRIAGDVING